MRILIVSRYKANYPKHTVPFVAEQGEAIAKYLREDFKLQIDDCRFESEPAAVELFLLRGNYLAQWLALREKIRAFRPDIIHAHYGLSCLIANLATRRVPVVSTYHGSDINLPRVRPFSRLAMRLSAWNIFVSQRTMQLVGAVEGRKCTLLPCGVAFSGDQSQTREEACAALGWRAEEKKVLFAGAFDNDVKNPELAKQAISDLKSQIGNVELIELKGYTRQQVNTLMCAAGALLMTSRTEGSPQVIKEAMACGCPIVSVDVGDVKERVNNIDGCYIVPMDDFRFIIENLTEALKKALAFRGKTKGRERIIAESLTNEQVAKRIIRIYEKILDFKF